MSAIEKPPIHGKLLAEFPPVTYDDWRKLVEAELKGAPFDKKMFTATYEGITLQPLYRSEDVMKLSHAGSFPGFAPFVRGASASGGRVSLLVTEAALDESVRALHARFVG